MRVMEYETAQLFTFKVKFLLPWPSWLLKLPVEMAKTDTQVINDNIMHYDTTQSVIWTKFSITRIFNVSPIFLHVFSLSFNSC